MIPLSLDFLPRPARATVVSFLGRPTQAVLDRTCRTFAIRFFKQISGELHLLPVEEREILALSPILAGEINQCVKEGNRDGLRKIAYKYLNRPNRDINHFVSALWWMFQSKRASLSDIGWLIAKADCQLPSLVISKQKREERDAAKKISKTWAEKVGRKPGEWISFSHGGGEQYIKDFLSRTREGCSLYDSNDDGLWVSPENNSRDFDYALRSPIQYFDNPVVLKGKIQATNLVAVPNGSEAGLTREGFSRAIEVTHSPLSLDDPHIRQRIISQLPLLSLQHVASLLPNHRRMTIVSSIHSVNPRCFRL